MEKWILLAKPQGRTFQTGISRAKGLRGEHAWNVHPIAIDIAYRRVRMIKRECQRNNVGRKTCNRSFCLSAEA